MEPSPTHWNSDNISWNSKLNATTKQDSNSDVLRACQIFLLQFEILSDVTCLLRSFHNIIHQVRQVHSRNSTCFHSQLSTPLIFLHGMFMCTCKPKGIQKDHLGRHKSMGIAGPVHNCRCHSRYQMLVLKAHGQSGFLAVTILVIKATWMLAFVREQQSLSHPPENSLTTYTSPFRKPIMCGNLS